MTGSPSAGSGFGRLRVKLFLAIAGANAVLAAIAYLVFSASFDRGFLEDLQRADQARLETFVASLAEGYAREGGWGWARRRSRALAEPLRARRSALSRLVPRAADAQATRACRQRSPAAIRRASCR